MEVVAEALIAGLNLGAKGVVLGAGLRAQVLDFSTELGAEGLVVGARVAPEQDQQTDQGYAQGEDGEDFGVTGSS